MSAGTPPGQSKTFCILPWIHLAVYPEGSAQLCCVAAGPVQAGGVPLSLQTHPLEAVWNSAYLRQARRDMAEGRHVADCSHCYVKERQGGTSRRQEANARWAAELGPLFDALVEESRHRDYEAAELPLYYQLMPGNLCNLKCRMCSPHFSTRIERDPVHRRWVPSLLDAEPAAPAAPLDWTRGRVRFGPEGVPEAEFDGFHCLEQIDGQPVRWTNGNATLTLALPRGVRARALELTVRGGVLPPRDRLRVRVNGTLVHDRPVPKSGQRASYTFVVPDAANRSTLVLQIQSGTFRSAGDTRELGVIVERLELVHGGTAAPAASRLPQGPWYRDDAWVRDVLLGNADRLRGLYFTGGEPMLERQVESVLGHLVDRGVAGNVVLEFNTNCTILRDSVLDKLRRFKESTLGLSIDSAGPWYEYIRYPAKWDAVSRNVDRLVGMASERFKLYGGVVLQVYNALNLTEVLEFFDARRVPYAIHLASWPAFLNVGVLPARVRGLAAARLRAYAEGRCRPERREHLLGVVEQIEKVKDRCSLESLRNLMLFTNDLDATRRQSVREVHGELLRLLDDEGFTWTDERSAPAAA